MNYFTNILKMSIVVLLLVYVGCKENSSEPSQSNQAKTITISGFVLDSTGQPISTASLTLIDQSGSNPTKTDISGIDGSYSFQITSSTNFSGRLVTLRQGYLPDTTALSAVTPGETRSLNVRLLRDWSQGVIGTTGTDYISYIELLSKPADISVRGTGNPETAELVFVGKDRSGLPVDGNHSSLVTFTLASPDLGAELTITSCPTDSQGFAKTIIRAGTISGVVQILATANVNGVIKQSSVVKISINAGLPDQRHFSISANRYNFAGLNWDGETDAVTVNMADKYSNPVSLNTVVYFCATHGKIVTSGSVSNNIGVVVQDYISQNPRPILNDTAYGPQNAYKLTLPLGWTRVYAQTFNDAHQVVQDSIDILWTGIPIIYNTGISGAQTITHNGGLSGFEFHVEDQYGHPLTSGTTITLTCEGAKISTTAPDLALPDMTVSGYGSTIFTASLSDGDGGNPPAVPKVSDLVVKVTHPLYGSVSLRLGTITIQ